LPLDNFLFIFILYLATFIQGLPSVRGDTWRADGATSSATGKGRHSLTVRDGPFSLPTGAGADYFPALA